MFHISSISFRKGSEKSYVRDTNSVWSMNLEQEVEAAKKINKLQTSLKKRQKLCFQIQNFFS